MVKTETITHYDDFSIKDYLGKNSELMQEKRKKSPFIGLVRLIKDGEVVSKEESKNGDGLLNNITVAIGREFANQKLFGIVDPTSSINNGNPAALNKSDLRKYTINAFGIGMGGTSFDTSGNLIFIPPSVCNVGLEKPLQINTINCLTEYNYIKDAHSQNVVKLITTPGATNPNPNSALPVGAGTITMSTSSSNVDYNGCTGKYYTITQCRCIIDTGEPYDINKTNPEPYVKIDEACLYITDENDQYPVPFARITFAPKFIEPGSVFIIEWYVIF